MLISRKESVITKEIKVLSPSSIGKSYKRIVMQRFLRTTYWVLFVPVFTYDKRID